MLFLKKNIKIMLIANNEFILKTIKSNNFLNLENLPFNSVYILSFYNNKS